MEKRGHKKILKSSRPVISVLTVVIALLLAEVATHFYYRVLASREAQYRFALFAEDKLPRVHPRYKPHPYFSYALTPRFMDFTGKTHHNSLGFRGPELCGAADLGHIRIVTLGGSTTYTTKVLDDKNSYPAQLEALLRAFTGNNEIEVVNAGVGGYTTWESFVNLAFRVLDLEPDIIVVYHAANDLHARRAIHYVGDNTGYRRLWALDCTLPLWVAKYCYLFRLVCLRLGVLKQLGVEHYTRRNDELIKDPPVSLLEKHPPAYFRRNLCLITRLAKSYGCEVVLCTFASNTNFRRHYAQTAYYRAGFVEMNRLIREVARSESVTLADVDAAIPRDTHLWVDGVHLNEKGAQIKAEIIAKSIMDAGLVRHIGVKKTERTTAKCEQRKYE